MKELTEWNRQHHLKRAEQKQNFPLDGAFALLSQFSMLQEIDRGRGLLPLNQGMLTQMVRCAPILQLG